MAYKPILFNTEMVQAILAGRKTQTRRIMKPQAKCAVPKDCATCNEWRLDWETSDACPSKCVTTPDPPCIDGDILWVRETWTKMPHYVYRADDEHPEFWDFDDRWHPSIHMPKEAARIFLRVKDVRNERLRDIGNADAIAEGFSGTPCHHENADPALGCTDCLNTGWLEPPYAEFAQLWDSTIKPADLDKYGWDANPWVWVIEFERCEKPEGWC